MAKKRAKAEVIEDGEVDDLHVEDVDTEDGPIPPGQLGDWQLVLPKEVQDAVDKYVEAMRDVNEARARKNSAYDDCIDIMCAHEIERVPIDDGKKYLVCEQVMKLKTEKLKEQESGE